jgi:2-phosphosulfolactate phosphatase
MKANVHFSPTNLDELYFSGKTSVVIDVLRATSTIVTALANGAREVIPVDSTDFAIKARTGTFGGQTLTGGERNTKKIDGFTFGNSPLEYSSENIKGKSIILFTSNGTKAIVKAKFSAELYICSFLNLKAVTNRLIEAGKDFEVICSGGNGFFCTEDAVCAGKIIADVQKAFPEIELNDSGKTALLLAKLHGKAILKMLSECEHGRILVENGFTEDIKYCSSLNILDVIPKFSANTIKLFAENNSSAS